MTKVEEETGNRVKIKIDIKEGSRAKIRQINWPDLAVMLQCGFAAAPSSAHAEALARVHWVSEARGGHGAVREVSELLLRAQNQYDALLAQACAADEQ